MRELNAAQVTGVSGGTDAGDIAMGAAGAHASGIVGLSVGAVIGGPIGAVAGYAAGAVLGTLIVVGYTLAQK